MKKQTNINSSAFNELIIVFFLIFTISCVKQTNPISNPNPPKPNPPTNPTGSQIIYTYENPDSVILDSNSRRLYNLDLNNDGIADFVFTETAEAATGCRAATGITYSGDVKPASGSGNAIVYDGGVPRPLDSVAVIDSNSYWTNDTSNEWLYSNTIGAAAKCDPPGGPWDYTSYTYLGLKFIKNGNAYYAWARISKGIDATSLILEGYAYNSIPNQQILAGQTK